MNHSWDNGKKLPQLHTWVIEQTPTKFSNQSQWPEGITLPLSSRNWLWEKKWSKWSLSTPVLPTPKRHCATVVDLTWTYVWEQLHIPMLEKDSNVAEASWQEQTPCHLPYEGFVPICTTACLFRSGHDYDAFYQSKDKSLRHLPVPSTSVGLRHSCSGTRGRDHQRCQSGDDCNMRRARDRRARVN